MVVNGGASDNGAAEENLSGPTKRRGIRALVYGDVNLNIIDGSAIWAQSMVQALARAGCEVTFLLKGKVQTLRLLEPLVDVPGITVVRPFEDGLVPGVTGEDLTPADLPAVLRRLDAERHFDLLVLRGLRASHEVALDETFKGRLWVYLTDIPQSLAAVTPESLAELTTVAEASRQMLWQTEELRSFVEAVVPAACGKSLLLRPIVPEPEFNVPQGRDVLREPVNLVYTGKFAPDWNTLQMTTLPRLLRDRGIQAELQMIGDKIHQDLGRPSFYDRMRNALEKTPGVTWHGGRSRQEAMELSARADIGLSWRNPKVESSLELSTKVLEFGLLGLPVILNRTPMHEALLGIDYPLFAQTEEDVLDAVHAAVRDPGVYADAAARCRAAAEPYTLQNAGSTLSGYLEQAFPSAPSIRGRGRRLRVGVVSHDWKFFSRLLDYLKALPQLDVRLDNWPALTKNDPKASQELADWAEVVICEWCGPNAVWYSRHKRPGQRLIVRLHRFELYAPWISEIEIDNVDQVVCVSSHYARLTRELTGWPEEKLIVVPNWVDVDQLDRPKLDGVRYHLGMIGAAPARKRPDLALDVLERVRAKDPRFALFVKTKMAWDYWFWKQPEEQQHLDDVLRRIQTSPLLRGAVVFDRFGPDVAAWLRKIGFVLSTSDDESFHLAPAEGMASGAVPVIRSWPGADTIYSRRWIHDTPDEMAQRILEIVQSGRWEEEREAARQEVRDSFALSQICRSWTRLLSGEAPARTANGSTVAVESVA
jgi:glycosyltransferase involved in cell wall biosynthesis